ncbi:MAG: ammonium transporter [Phycisphaerales bacterium]
MPSPADSLWVLLAAILVLLMTPSLGLFYGGLVRSKNVLSTLMYGFFTVALVSIQWVVLGFSLAFGASTGGWIGSLEHVGLAGVGMSIGEGETIPKALFMMFQMSFAVITPALISGAFVERKRFGAFVLFTLLWATLVYDPIAHWVWNPEGWLFKDGALDFAGGTVVHVSSGISALVCALVIGRRQGYGNGEIRHHDATLTILGAALLWFGWFGFNAGSALAVNNVATNALVTTHCAASAAAIVWLALGAICHKRPSVIGAALGAVAGLVGITPAAGFVSPMSAIAIGMITSAVCFFVTEYVVKGRIDDSLDVFGVHGVGGIVGAILTGVFAAPELTNGSGGLLSGNATQVWLQAKAVLAVALFAGVMTFVILRLIKLVVPIRVSAEQEAAGLDLSQHGEAAYSTLPSVATPAV